MSLIFKPRFSFLTILNAEKKEFRTWSKITVLIWSEDEVAKNYTHTIICVMALVFFKSIQNNARENLNLFFYTTQQRYILSTGRTMFGTLVPISIRGSHWGCTSVRYRAKLSHWILINQFMYSLRLFRCTLFHLNTQWNSCCWTHKTKLPRFILSEQYPCVTWSTLFSLT